MNIQSLDVQEYNDKNVDEHLKDEESLEEDHIEGVRVWDTSLRNKYVG